VQGRLANSELDKLDGWHIQLVDKNVGEEVVLGEAVTDVEGRYKIEYDTAPLQYRGKERVARSSMAVGILLGFLRHPNLPRGAC